MPTSGTSSGASQFLAGGAAAVDAGGHTLRGLTSRAYVETSIVRLTKLPKAWRGTPLMVTLATQMEATLRAL